MGKEIRIADYPQLKFLCWNLKDDTCLDEAIVLSLYERNWRFVEVEKLDSKERALIDRLVIEYGNGVFNV